MNNFFYESHHSIGLDYCQVYRNANVVYPFHLHRCYEIILMTEGAMKVCIEKNEYTISAGDMILVKSNLAHSFNTIGTSCCLMGIFSPELISAISDSLIKYRMVSPIIHNVPQLYHDLFESICEKRDFGMTKGVLYCLCSLFHRQLDFSQEDPDVYSKHLLRKALHYVESNVQNACTLQELADNLGYTTSYLSRYFYTNVGIAFSEYVKNVKISYACYLLRGTQSSILQIMAQCGYVSSTTFHRNFRQVVGYSPTEYRRKMKKESDSIVVEYM